MIYICYMDKKNIVSMSWFKIKCHLCRLYKVGFKFNLIQIKMHVFNLFNELFYMGNTQHPSANFKPCC